MLISKLFLWISLPLGNQAYAQDVQPTGQLSVPTLLPPQEGNVTALIIRKISIEVRNVFDEADPSGFYAAVNGLKISTKEEVIRQELLFKEGDVYDEFRINESERRLRSLRFLNNVSITSTPDGPFLDIVVRVQDTWTLFPQFSFSSGGGSNKRSIGLVETDLLGFGKRVELFNADEDGRKTNQGVFDDIHVLGTRNHFLLGHFDRSDGFRTVLVYELPFRSLVQKTGWQTFADISDTVGKLFQDNAERFVYRQRHNEESVGYTFARGDPEVLVRRYSFGWDFNEDKFRQADGSDFADVNVDPSTVSQDSSLLADNRRFSGPYFAIEQTRPDFISLKYVDRFQRVEDFNLGNNLTGKVTVSPEIFGSMHDTLLLSLSDTQGIRLGVSSFLLGDIGVSSRADHRGLQNSFLRSELKYYNVLGSRHLFDFYLGRHTLASSLLVDFGENLDRDRELLLGASSGLRGYKGRAFSGDKRLVLNLEDRFYLVDNVFKLVDFGGAFFFDAGGATYRAAGNLLSDVLYTDVGFGLRLGFPRSGGGGGVLRIDVAFPLRDGPDGSSQFQPRLLISTGQVFSARARSQQLGAQNANIEVGLVR